MLKWHEKLLLCIAVIFFGMLIVISQPKEKILKAECINIPQQSWVD
jgi:hypothetical protein